MVNSPQLPEELIWGGGGAAPPPLADDLRVMETAIELEELSDEMF